MTKKQHTTNYINTFIAVAEDCKADCGEIPPVKENAKTVANIQFDILINNPYVFTSDDVLFQVFADKNDITPNEYPAARETFFSKGQPCFRASPLTKRYGWGVHNNTEGKIAIYSLESEKYQALSEDKSLIIVKAMRSSK